MKTVKFLPLFMLLVLGLTSCKYEEGPFLSFVPREERVANTWIVGRAVVNGEVASSLDDIDEITFTKEGRDVEFKRDFVGIPYTLVGSWAFNEDESAIALDLVDDGLGILTYQRTWTIRKLKENDFWVSFTEDQNGATITYEIEWTPKN